MLFNQIQKVISPWESSDQVLPEEHVTAEDTNGDALICKERAAGRSMRGAMRRS